MGSKGGGSGGGGTQFNQTTTTLPDWLDKASQGAVTTAQGLSERPYTPYTGQIVATPGADTSQAYQQVREMQGAYNPAFQQSADAYGGLLGQVNPLTASGINDISNQLYGNFQSQVMNPAQGLLGGYAAGGPATAQQVGANATALMSPYTQNVIDPTLAAGEQAREIARQKVAGQAANVGAFGGSRQGVAEGVSDAQSMLGTQQQIGQMLQSGWGQALSPAASLALQAGQQGYGAAGLLAGMGQSGYNAAQQMGQGIAGTNLQAGMSAAQQLPAQALQQQAAMQKDASLMQSIGAAQQNQQQQQLNAQMGQFYEQQDYPVQNLDILLASLGAVPYGSTTTSIGQAKPDPAKKNVAGSVLGGAASGASTGMMIGGPWGAAAGAVAGGILGGLS